MLAQLAVWCLHESCGSVVHLLLFLQLRLAGNALAGGGDLEAAISKYQEVRTLSNACTLAWRAWNLFLYGWLAMCSAMSSW